MSHLAYKILLITFFTLLVLPPPVFAQNCKPIYGGGITKEQACDGKKVTTPAQTKTTATPTPPKSRTTTKGGLPVVSPTQQQQTPSTGPEVIGLVALLPAAGLGYYLRKKS